MYLSLKTAHLLSMVVLFGVGLGTAWYKWMADRSGRVAHIAATNRHVVLADWLFTTPTIFIQPLTGFALLWLVGIPWTEAWVLGSLVLYLLAGACWLPVVWLQMRMRELSGEAVRCASALPPQYWRYARTWFWLGVPAFSAMMAIVVLMVFKPVWR
ncbi:MAG: DUF2269 domain-containing protein [Gammaproteobacteria bacterium]|nr:DUF2269 domain-containing protein [Gammaproteobacteria bacterium]TVQ47671.1 MAG: DUF2269 domain-containing protein [Gammaproteobacteria bacterium]